MFIECLVLRAENQLNPGTDYKIDLINTYILFNMQKLELNFIFINIV
jgi:hypothetical protein